jgi:hypothetical protein
MNREFKPYKKMESGYYWVKFKKRRVKGKGIWTMAYYHHQDEFKSYWELFMGHKEYYNSDVKKCIMVSQPVTDGNYS